MNKIILLLVYLFVNKVVADRAIPGMNIHNT